MKKTGQFLPLLKQMLGFRLYGPIPLVLWFVSCGTVLYLGGGFSPVEWMRGHNGVDFVEMQIWSAILLWFFLMLISTPLPTMLLGGRMSMEFLFTRAIDREVWLRSERMAVIIITTGPLMFNLALSPWATKLAFDPADSTSAAGKVQAQYVNAFPGSHLAIVDKEQGEQLVIHHGTETFAAWLLWSALVFIFLVAGYFTLIFSAWQRAGWHHSKSKWRPWLGLAMVNAPAYSVILVFTACMHFSKVNLYEESFLFFAGHPLMHVIALIALIAVVQPASESNLRKLEFEFA